MTTGKNPGKHGLISFFERSAERYHIEPPAHPTVTSRSIQSETIWDVFSETAVDHIVLNLPVTYPPGKRPHRTMVSGMMTPSDVDDYYYPTDIGDLLDHYVIDYYGREKRKLFDATALDQTDFLEQSAEMAASRHETTQALAEACDWDVLMPVFTGTDRLAHYFWDYFEDESDRTAELDKYYSDLDGYIASILDLVDLSEDYVFFVSDHGFGPSPKKVVAMNSVLAEHGLLNINRSTGAEGHLARMRQHRLLRRIGKKLLPKTIKNRLKEELVGSLTDLIDWSTTKAYATPLYANVFGIEVNRVGQKSEGIVSDNEYEMVRDQVMDICWDVKDPETGEAIVTDVQRREDMYHGAASKSLPDVIVTMKENYDLTTLLEDNIVGEKTSTKIGDHRDNGIFVLLGPDVQSARVDQPHNIVDVAPTLSYLADVPQNEDFDGSIIADAFEHQVPTQPVKDFSDLEVHSGGGNDSESVRERLDDLGYM
jgi:predicted AlkP superfamily phosphohydrolase/phosphomutase